MRWNVIGQLQSMTGVANDSWIAKVLMPKEFQFQAGQFVMIDFGRTEEGVVVRRAYSIASASSALPVIELAIRISSTGSKSETFLRRLSEGAELKIEGPYGQFLYQEREPRRKLFLAAGTGIAPIRSMILTWAEENGSSAAHLLYGAVDASHLLFLNDFRALEARQPKFKMTLTLDQLSGTPEAVSGRPTDHLGSLIPEPEQDVVYICGPPPMVTSAEELLASLGFRADQIKKERF